MTLIWEKVVVTAKDVNSEEIWKDIEGYDGMYQVSDLGRIRSFQTGRWKFLKGAMSGFRRGYIVVALYKNFKMKLYLVHRLVGFAFVPNPENKPEINHIGKDENGVINRTDNRAISLEWATSKENIQHAIVNGLIKLMKPKQKIKMGRGRFILNLETGIYYKGRREAANVSNFNFHSLGKMLCGIKKNRSSFVYV